ncbi:MAG: DUF922 domain-containing protein [Aeromonas molluscorum]|uniref:DUF922 domain-containing protein n=1 Tax=Aeromonas molluscorum TaxID=271417 RepID=UPI003CADD5A8
MGKLYNLAWGLSLLWTAAVGATQAHYTGVKIEPDIRVDFQFYKVKGATMQAALAQASSIGPKGSLGQQGLGMASYQLNWSMLAYPLAGNCSLNGVKVTTRIKVMVPEWVNKSQASVREQQNWNIMVGAMLDYESRHKDIVQETASAIGFKLSQLPRSNDCAALRHQGDLQGQALLAQAKSRFARLAEQTDHGRKLGLSWPFNP